VAEPPRHARGLACARPRLAEVAARHPHALLGEIRDGDLERFRELANAIAALNTPTLILDGEVCVFDKDLVSQFHPLGGSDSDELMHGRLRDPRPACRADSEVKAQMPAV